MITGRYVFLLLLLILVSGCTGNYHRLKALMKEGEVQPKAFSESIHFEYRQDFIFLKVRLDDQKEEFNFLLDSSSPTVLSPRTAAKIGADTLFEYREETEQELKSTCFTRIDRVKLGNLVFRDIGAVIDAHTEPFLFDSLGIDGIIGANLMQHACWQINYREQLLTIADGKTNQPDVSKAVAVTFFRNIYRAPKFDLLINRYPGKRVTRLSTGFNGGLKMPRSEFDHFHSIMYYDTLQVRLDYDNVGEGVSYLVRQDKATPDAARFLSTRYVRIGEIEAEYVPSVFRRGKYFYLGNGFLENYILTIDWRKRKFFMEKNKP